MSTTYSNLAKKLVRLAYTHPEKRATIIPMIRKLAAAGPNPNGSNWKKSENPTRWNWSNPTGASFTVSEKPGPGAPIYVLKMLSDDGSIYKHIKPFQWNSPEGAFKAAADAFRYLWGKSILKDMTTNWSKLSSTAEEPEDDATSKLAAGSETEDFVRWVLSTQAPMSANEVESFVERGLNIKTSPPVKRDTSGPRFKHGDLVQIVAAKHKAAKYDIGPYHLYNGKIGTVASTDGMDALVTFQGESAPVRIPGAMESRGVGIYKYTRPYDIEGSAKIEMIYFAGGESTHDAKIVVDAYLSRSKKTEKRSANYYTGYVVMASVGANGYYFRGFPQQRMQVDPQSEGGFQARTFNPTKGEVFYIGVFGKRPSTWKSDLAKLDEAAGVTAE